jgi:hypothetical protein
MTGISEYISAITLRINVLTFLKNVSNFLIKRVGWLIELNIKIKHFATCKKHTTLATISRLKMKNESWKMIFEANQLLETSQIIYTYI